MKHPNEKPQSIPKCKVISLKNDNHKIEVIPEDQAFKLKAHDYNIYINRVNMKTYIKLSNGKPIKYHGPIEKIDGKPLGLLKKLILRPDVYLSHNEIGHIGKQIDSYYIKDNIISYVAKLRKYLFQENGRKSNVICTTSRPYRIALNGNNSFCWIERYHESAEPNAITD